MPTTVYRITEELLVFLLICVSAWSSLSILSVGQCPEVPSWLHLTQFYYAVIGYHVSRSKIDDEVHVASEINLVNSKQT